MRSFVDVPICLSANQYGQLSAPVCGVPSDLAKMAYNPHVKAIYMSVLVESLLHSLQRSRCFTLGGLGI